MQIYYILPNREIKVVIINFYGGIEELYYFYNMMKQLYRTLILLFAITMLVSCSKSSPSIVYGQWTVLHIIKDNEEILKNDFLINGEHVPHTQGVKFVIDSDSKSVTLFTNPKIIALFELSPENNIQYLKISDATEDWLNGQYFVTIEIRNELVDNVRAKIYYAKLESDHCILYLKKGTF